MGRKKVRHSVCKSDGLKNWKTKAVLFSWLKKTVADKKELFTGVSVMKKSLSRWCGAVWAPVLSLRTLRSSDVHRMTVL